MNVADKKIAVGMSGGVDSAVAALLLKRQGADVVGVFMKNWDDSDENAQCPAEADYEDMVSVCDRIRIPYYAVNFEKEYRERVFKYFLEEYETGRTPNPDVLCNSEIKFAAFLDFVKGMGVDYMATGHYANVSEADGTYYLKKGYDLNKDQSYFLCLLTQRQLSSVIFPIGGMQKSKVRKIAEEEGLTVAHKKDSNGICFIGERKFKRFLQNYLPTQPGEIRSLGEIIIGKHDGLMYYTLGQRRGLNIGGQPGGSGKRWFVVKKDLKNNVLYVSEGESDDLFSSALSVTNFHYISGEPKQREFCCSAKVRYRQTDQKAVVTKNGESGIYVEFDEKQRAVTPGQYCVLYEDDICLGGGVIDEIFT